MSSIPRFEAASISIRSSARPSSMASQTSHSPSGSPSRGDLQFTALARMRAVLVFPVPRGPHSR